MPATWKDVRPSLGARLVPGGVRFEVWAPFCRKLSALLLSKRSPIPMEKDEWGYFRAYAPGAAAGDDYVYRLDDKTKRPDPASRFQPFGVHGASRVVDPDAFG